MNYSKNLAGLLNELLQKTYDAKKGYQLAVEKVENPSVKQFLKDKVTQRRHFAADLKTAILEFGWEVEKEGSFKGQMHRAWMELTASLTGNETEREAPGREEKEIVESRRRLQSLLDMPILSFAYPFGTYDKDSVHYAYSAGYIAAMGLGVYTYQGKNNLYYLSRREIKGDYSLQTFSSYLPWQEDVNNLPVPTP